MRKISANQIKALALKHKFTVNPAELAVIQKEFTVNVMPNLRLFDNVFAKYGVGNEPLIFPLTTRTYFRADFVIDDQRRADFLLNLKNKTPDGYVYVLKQKNTRSKSSV